MKTEHPVLRILSSVIRQHKMTFAGFILFTLGSVAASLIPPQMLRLVIDRCLEPKSTQELFKLTAFYLAAIVFTDILDFLKNSSLTVLGQKTLTAVRRAMFRKLSSLPVSFFTRTGSGKTASYFLNDTDNINTLFADGAAGMFSDCLKLVGIVFSVFSFGWKSGLLVICCIPVILLFSRLFRRRMYRAQTDNLKQLGSVNGHINETLADIRMVKVFGIETYLSGIYRQKLRANYVTNEKVNFFDSFYSPLIKLIRCAMICAVVMLSVPEGGVLGISVGTLAALISFISDLLAPIEGLGMELQDIQKGLSGIGRIEDLLSHPDEQRPEPVKDSSSLIREDRAVTLSFDNVVFSYAGSDAPVIDGLSFSTVPFRPFTITGRTGAGKSTILKLAAGIEKPDSGSVRINDVDVRSIPDALRRRVLGYISQDRTFIEGTVKDQITLRDPDISDDMVKKAIISAGLDEKIASLPQGADTVFEEDGMFSQGEKQLICAARAVVCDPPLLILDEASADLDEDCERKLLSVLSSKSTRRSIVSVSHRKSSIISGGTVVQLKQGSFGGGK